MREREQGLAMIKDTLELAAHGPVIPVILINWIGDHREQEFFMNSEPTRSRATGYTTNYISFAIQEGGAPEEFLALLQAAREASKQKDPASPAPEAVVPEEGAAPAEGAPDTRGPGCDVPRADESFDQFEARCGA